MPSGTQHIAILDPVSVTSADSLYFITSPVIRITVLSTVYSDTPLHYYNGTCETRGSDFPALVVQGGDVFFSLLYINCPTNCQTPVYGTAQYNTSSSICTAARHAGVVSNTSSNRMVKVLYDVTGIVLLGEILLFILVK